MTQVSEQPTTTVGERAEERVRRSIRALRSVHTVSIKTVCERTGIKRGTFFSRMNGSTSFTAGEVAELADLFGVTVEELYSGVLDLGGSPTPDPSGPFSPTGGPARDGGLPTREYVGSAHPSVVIPVQFSPTRYPSVQELAAAS